MRQKLVARTQPKTDIVRRIFNEYADVYDDVVNEDFLLNRDHCRDTFLHFLETHLPSGNARILDVGCGSGVPALDLMRRSAHYDVRGFDVSEDMIQVLKMRGVSMGIDPKELTDRFFVCSWDDWDTVRTTTCWSDQEDNKYDLILFRGANADLCESEDALKDLLKNMLELTSKRGTIQGKILIGLRNWEMRLQEQAARLEEIGFSDQNKYKEPRRPYYPAIQFASNHLILQEFASRPITTALTSEGLHTVQVTYQYDFQLTGSAVTALAEQFKDSTNRIHLSAKDIENLQVDFVFARCGPTSATTPILFRERINNLMVTTSKLIELLKSVERPCVLKLVIISNETMAGNHHLYLLLEPI